MQSGGESPETREPRARAQGRYSAGGGRPSMPLSFSPARKAARATSAARGAEVYFGKGIRLSPLAASVDWIGPTARSASAAIVSVGLAVAEVGKVPEPSRKRL